jgi:hypothetical protein
MRGAGTLLLLCVLATGCQFWGIPREHCSGAVAVTNAPRTLHVRVQLTHAGAYRRHEAVVQVEAERIRVVGLTPMGTRAFGIEHAGERIEIENRVGGFMGQRPRLVYDAIARAFLAPPAADATPTPLPHGGERMGETSRHGEVAERRYLPLEGAGGAAIVVYEQGPGARAARVTNTWCEYEALVVVVSDETPPAAPPAAARSQP